MRGTSVLATVQEGIGTITLNRSQAHNALGLPMCDELAAAVLRTRDDSDAHTVFLTGAGGALCSGGDIGQMFDASQKGLPRRDRIRRLHQRFADLVSMEIPVMAAVDGPAFDVGLSLALVADFVLATPRAKFCVVFECA